MLQRIPKNQPRAVVRRQRGQMTQKDAIGGGGTGAEVTAEKDIGIGHREGGRTTINIGRGMIETTNMITGGGEPIALREMITGMKNPTEEHAAAVRVPRELSVGGMVRVIELDLGMDEGDEAIVPKNTGEEALQGGIADEMELLL